MRTTTQVKDQRRPYFDQTMTFTVPDDGGSHPLTFALTEDDVFIDKVVVQREIKDLDSLFGLNKDP